MIAMMPRLPTKPEHGPRRSRTFRLSEALMERLEALAERNRRPMTTELEIAVEGHLEKNDLWPPETEPSTKKSKA